MADRQVLTRKRIGVLMGGQSSEREISLRTGQAVHQSLLRRGYHAVAIDVGPDLHRDLTAHQIELAFLSLHGPGGEDGTIQGFLETIGIPYTGSGEIAGGGQAGVTGVYDRSHDRSQAGAMEAGPCIGSPLRSGCDGRGLYPGT